VLAEKGIVSIDDFYEIRLNPAAIAWFASGRNYRAIATAAVNEAGGRGFIREYAGPSSIAERALYDEANFDFEQMRGARDPANTVYWVLARFPLDATLAEILAQFAPMPAYVADQGIAPIDYYSCMECWGVPEQVDTEGLEAALDAVLVTPLRDAQALFDRHPYVTRLFTTISPDEMIVDPLFRENDTVPDVSNVQVAQAQRRCDVFHRERNTAPIHLTLPDGQRTTVYAGDPLHPSSNGMIDEDGNGVDDRQESASATMPSLAQAIQYRETGPGSTIIDNRDRIEQLLDGEGGSGCGVAPGAGHGSWVVLLVGLLGALRLRARRRARGPAGASRSTAR
jgi:MYXO-CTERM domain-containing protein